MRRTPFFAVPLFLIGLAACTAGTPPPAATTKEPEAVETRTLAPPSAPEPQPHPPKKPVLAAVPPPQEINDDPAQFLGLDGHRVAARLGPASFVRRDGPAEVWQYRAEACVLDLYLYKENGGLTVAHVDLRKRPAATLPARRCFAALLERQR